MTALGLADRRVMCPRCNGSLWIRHWPWKP